MPEPGECRIVGARAEAWVGALAGLGLAVVDEVGDVTGAWRDRCSLDMDRATRLRPVRAGCLPLLIGFHHLQGVPDAVVHLGAGEPAVPLLSIPDCGCDACDDGSDPLLKELDKHVVAVVSGAFVHVTTKRGTIAATGPDLSASGPFPRGFDFDALLTEVRAGRRCSEFDQRTPSPSTVARKARSLTSTLAKSRSSRFSAYRSQASASTPAVPQQRPLLSQKPGRTRRGRPE